MTRPDSDDRTKPTQRDDASEPTPKDGASAQAPFTLPEGTLVRSRVESDPAVPLESALDRELTGYAVFEPQEALLLGGDGAGVLAFEEGIPRFATYTATDASGPTALADVAPVGPYSVELRELPAEELADFERPDRRVPPGMAADRLAGDPDLAERTREAAPPEWMEGGEDEEPGDGGSLGAVEAFLDDEEKVAAIRDRAREEAQERAEEWGLDGELE
jgi:hypothetical protein